MTIEQSPAVKAINARRFLGDFSRWTECSGTIESQANGYYTQAFAIPFATSTTSGAGLVIHGMPRDVPQAGRQECSYLVAKSGTGWVSVTGIKRQEIFEFPKQAAFEELQEVRADESKFRAVLRDLRSQTAISEREPIAHRLEELMEDFQSDYGRSLDADSLRTFLALLSLYPKLRKPSITADENGNLYAEWKSQDHARSLGILILPMHQVRFVAFRPDDSLRLRKKHISGIAPVEQLFTDLASYDILSWACVP